MAQQNKSKTVLTSTAVKLTIEAVQNGDKTWGYSIKKGTELLTSAKTALGTTGGYSTPDEAIAAGESFISKTHLNQKADKEINRTSVQETIKASRNYSQVNQ